MSRRVQTYSRKNLSAKASLKYRNERRKRRRQHNKLEDVSVIECVSMPMGADKVSPSSQHGTPDGGQVRVTYDEQLPFAPLPHEVPEDKAGIALGLCPIIQTNEVVDPIAYGSKIRVQNFGGKGGPAQGNFKKMRPVSIAASADSAFALASLKGAGEGISSGGWGMASMMSAVSDFLGLGPEKEEPPPSKPSDPVLTIEQLQAKYEGVETKTMPNGDVLEGEYIVEDGKMYFEYSTGMFSDKQRLGVFK